MNFLQQLMADPRHYQIMVLSTLVSLQVFWADFGPAILVVGLTIMCALVVQVGFSYFKRIRIDVRSPLITALSLSVLLKSNDLLLLPLAAVVAISSKFLLRVNGSHIFNPANIAIVVMLLTAPTLVWVSPGQWGSSIWLALLLSCFAFMVLYRVAHRDVVFVFLVSWIILVFSRALWLGDPIAIPLHQIQNGALLIFAFFMVSDPKTTPNHAIGRVVFSIAVAILGYILLFEFHIREGLFFALATISLMKPLIDVIWKASPYQWRAQ